MEINADIEIDLSGLQCPMPLLKAKLALNSMDSTQVLKVVATDPSSEKDFHMFVDQTDHQILDFQKDDSAYFYWIKKG
ncbi:MAG: sulfurtransferase TusA family protein [Gammaproteobacteria bacterium]|jgi:tRNA 2-thiouridine synthesizing protein A|nr:sulfurtransferase TusA family protein [Gammaproteobacteria bacterium]|tara:strand:+ start:341 stop:574 length:234 start_codon:yes stop_codon:yes gene_type:complete